MSAFDIKMEIFGTMKKTKKVFPKPGSTFKAYAYGMQASLGKVNDKFWSPETFDTLCSFLLTHTYSTLTLSECE